MTVLCFLGGGGGGGGGSWMFVVGVFTPSCGRLGGKLIGLGASPAPPPPPPPPWINIPHEREVMGWLIGGSF